ncbi:MAG TPA: M15 family metallopeptidase [candidate division Zixibacteria bacterium]|nr:M15 family metallopeptidase [candidate division Zixibacteria bacterium]
MNRLTLPFTYLVLAIVTLIIASTVTAQCPETIILNSTSYAVPEQWRDICIDSTRLADTSRLVKLPEKFCFQGYRIFVTPETRRAFEAMADAARKDSVIFTVKSGYRSSSYQKTLLRKRMDKGMSFAEACRYVAPPGFSEHETGAALDLTVTKGTFAGSTAYRWLKENGARFGFVETYPDDSLAQLPWEPWHWCYNPEEATEHAGASSVSASSPN